MTDWSTPEAAKVRRKAAAWANVRVTGPALGARTHGRTLDLYAEAIGTTPDAAQERIATHQERIAAFEATAPQRRVTDARPRPEGPDWSGKHARTIRNRCRALANRVCTHHGNADTFRDNWPTNWKPIQGV